MVIAIVQPGKIGDIIICLPIAYSFSRRRQEVIWPIYKSLLPMFAGAVDYVKFIPVDNYDLETSIAAVSPYNPAQILPLGFGFRGYERLTRLWLESRKRFDEYKYQVAGVPFDQKNQLVIRRNREREEELYRKVIKRDVYHVVMTTASDCSIAVEASNKGAGERVEITDLTDSVFDWLLVLERASAYFMIDSCMVNLASQMGFNAPGVRCWKPGYRNEHDYPVLRENWTDYRQSCWSGIAKID